MCVCVCVCVCVRDRERDRDRDRQTDRQTETQRQRQRQRNRDRLTGKQRQRDGDNGNMPGESYRRRLRSLLLYLCYVFRALINSLVCRFAPTCVWFLTSALSILFYTSKPTQPGLHRCHVGWKLQSHFLTLQTHPKCSPLRMLQLPARRAFGEEPGCVLQSFPGTCSQ